MPKKAAVVAVAEKKIDLIDWTRVTGLTATAIPYTGRLRGEDVEKKKLHLDDIVDRLAEIEAATAGLEEEAKALKAVGAEIMLRNKIKSVACDGYRTTQTSGASTTISREELLKRGVKAKDIDAATRKTPWTSLKITKLGDGGGGEEE